MARTAVLLAFTALSCAAAFDEHALRSNIAFSTFFSTCNACSLLRELSEDVQAVQAMNGKVVELCEDLPGGVGEQCVQAGLSMIERMRKAMAVESVCSSSCGANSLPLNTLTFCNLVQHFREQSDWFVETALADGSELCAKERSPSACIARSKASKPMLKGILDRTLARLAAIIDDENQCGFERSILAKSKESSNADSISTSAPPTAPSLSKKIVCELCDTMVMFLGQILDGPESGGTITGAKVAAILTEDISAACQKFLKKPASDCDGLASTMMSMVGFLLNEIDTILCGDVMKCAGISK